VPHNASKLPWWIREIPTFAIPFVMFVLGIISGALLYGGIHWLFRKAHDQETRTPLHSFQIPPSFPKSQLYGYFETVVSSYPLKYGSADVALRVSGEDFYSSLGAIPESASQERRAIFEIGSLTKLFTGCAIHRVIESDPSLSLNSSICSIDSWSFEGGDEEKNRALRSINFLDLLTHTSGLPRLPAKLTYTDLVQPYEDFSWSDLRAGFCACDAEERGPYSYSNFGYAILGDLVSDLSGEDLGACFQNCILGPLSLDDTGYSLTEAQQSRLASPMAKGGYVPVWKMNAFSGAGGLLSTTKDLLRFGSAHFSRSEFRRPDSFAPLPIRKIYSTGSASSSIGFTWHVESENTLDIYWHNGRTNGSRSYLAVLPDHNISVVVLSNYPQLDVEELGRRLLYLALRVDPQELE